MNEKIILENFAKRFSELVKNSSIDISKLAEMLGLKSKSTIYRYMNGEMMPKIPMVKYASEIFNVNPVWLMGYDVPMERELSDTKKLDTISLAELFKDQVPLLGTVKAGYDYLANENILEYIPISIKKEDNNYYALKIKGDSMETVMSEGDIVVVHKQDDFESGRVCVILINGDEATVKKVYKLEDGIELVALNPAYPSKKFTAKEMKTVPVQVIGIVKQLIKNY